MFRISLTVIFICFMQTVFSQEKEEPITTVKGLIGYKFIQNEKYLTYKDLSMTFENYPELKDQVKKARIVSSIGGIFAFGGGVLIGSYLGQAAGGGDPDLILLGAGGGLLFASIPFYGNASRNFKKAVDNYNSTCCSASSLNRTYIDFGLNSAGIGITLHF